MKEKEMEGLHPNELCLGNFFESMGKVEMVTGIMINENGQYQIAHHGWHEGASLLPPDVLISSLPIPLTDEWKKCFNIETYNKLPKWIKYVHQVQNYFFWNLQINIHDIMDWDKLPHVIDIN